MSLKPSADTYQVIARRYRPQTFADVIGQEPIVTTLKNALRFNRLAHAYLFCGCRGTGKTTLARVFSKALNCQQLTSNFEPCNKCQSCQEVSQGRSLDVIEIDGASHRGIDDIRQINETIGYASASGKYKIYIIDEVHMLTKEAFNALLKTLEEPPANVKFFFATTEPHKVLQTIMSRCQRFDLSRITYPLIQEKLAMIASDLHLSVEEDALQLIAKLSEGSLRDAESLFDQVICYNEGTLTAEKVSTSLGIVSLSVFFELDEAVGAQDLSYAFVLAEKIFSSGKDLSYFLDSLIEHFRTILAFQLGQPPHLTPLYQKKYTNSATQIYNREQTLYLLDYLLGWIQQMSKSTFKRISIEMILLHIIRSKRRVPIDTLVRRLHEIQKTLPAFDTAASEALAAPLPPKLEEIKPVEAKQFEPAKIDQPAPQASTPPIKEEVAVPEIEVKAEEKQEMPAAITPAPAPAPIEGKPAALTQEVHIVKQEIIHVEQMLDLPVERPAAPAPILTKVVEAVKTTTMTERPQLSEPAKITKPQSRHETVIRFAAVELDGVFSKN